MSHVPAARATGMRRARTEKRILVDNVCKKAVLLDQIGAGVEGRWHSKLMVRIHFILGIPWTMASWFPAGHRESAWATVIR